MADTAPDADRDAGGPSPVPQRRQHERYLKRERLRRRRDFLRVQQGGRRFTTPRMTVLLLANDLDGRRFGVTVSTKVGNSVTRSRVKRRLRDLYRRNRELVPLGYDVVVIARRDAVAASFDELRDDLTRFARWARDRARKERSAR